MALDWIVAAGFEITPGNSLEVLKALGDSARVLLVQIEQLERATAAYSETLAAMGTEAGAAADRVAMLDKAFRGSAAAGTRAGAGADRAAAGYERATEAALAAAAAAERYDVAASAGARGGAGARAGAGGGHLGGIIGQVGHAAMFTGEVGLGYLTDAVYEAGKLQQILVSTKNISGANPQQMERARTGIFSAADMSGESAAVTADMFREIVRMSQGSMSFDSMLGLLPQMARMQVVMHAVRGQSVKQTVDNTMAMVHLFRKYDPHAQPAMMDTVLRMSELMPDSPNRAVTQLVQFLPTLKNLHVTDEDAASLMVAVSRFGMGRGRGGTSIQNLAANALGPLQMTSHAQQGKAALLGPKGLNVLDAHGKSRFFTDKGGDIMGFLSQLASWEKQHGAIAAQKTFEGAFGKQGSRIADILADPVMIQQLKNIVKAMHDQKSLGLDTQAKGIMGTAAFQTHRAWSNFQSIATELGEQALPAVTKGMKDLGDALHAGQVWLHAHPALLMAIQHSFMDTLKGFEKFLKDNDKEIKQFGAGLLAVALQLPAITGFFETLLGIFLKFETLLGNAPNSIPALIAGPMGPLSAAMSQNQKLDGNAFQAMWQMLRHPQAPHIYVHVDDHHNVTAHHLTGGAGFAASRHTLARTGSVPTLGNVPAPLTFASPFAR